MLGAIIAHAQARGLIGSNPEGIVDATGLEVRHASLHYINHRANAGQFRQRFWTKLTVVCHQSSHLWVGAAVSRGPSNDSPQFAPAVIQSSAYIQWDRILADAAYDSEAHHRLCRETLGIRSTVIPINNRGNFRMPKTRYRRQMRKRFPSRVYRHRYHVESSFSQDKRLLGSALRARSEQTRNREVILRVLTHNLMILKRCA